MARRNPLVNLPSDVADFIREKHGNREVNVSPLPYWSTTQITATRAAGPPVSFAVAAGTQVTAFSYGVNGDMGAAGRPGVLATANDTNLQTAGQTRENSDVFIWGLACYATQDSEPEMLAQLFRSSSLTISTNGSTVLPLGTLEHFPAGGGLYGAGMSSMREPGFAEAGAANSGPGVAMPFASNGNPMSGNFFRLPQPLLWSGIGGGGSDNTLSVVQTVNRAFAFTCAVARPAAAGIAAFDAPAAAGDRGTFAGFRWRLVCVSVTPRTVN